MAQPHSVRHARKACGAFPTGLFLLGWVLVSAAGCGENPELASERGPKFVLFQAPAVPLLSNHINQIVANRNSQVWIATDSGAGYFERGAWGNITDSLKYWNYGSGVPPWQSARVTCITIGQDGSIWFGTGGGGIRRLMISNSDDGVHWITYKQPTISFNTISSIACEDVVNGEVWAGTLAAGVNRFIPSSSDPRFGSWVNYDASDVPGFGSNFIQKVVVNFIDRSAWVSTPFSLQAFFGEITGWREFEIPPPYDYQVFSIAFDLAGDAWLGKAEGVSRFDHSSSVWSHWTANNTGGVLPHGRIFAVATDLHRLRWFGTSHGLVRMADTLWTRFDRSVFPDWPSDTITTITYDRSGNLWIGTPNGIVVYNEAGTKF